ncbi:MAG: PAS domain-containing protein, partial [Actinomycetia bacterium]|nr:PAS domain-containing protein [Actinomycetes bacterium]
MSTVITIHPDLGEDLAGMLEVIGRTTDAMIGIDADLRIIAWNDAATALFGYAAGEALMRPCHEILRWRDRCGNAVCDESCPSRSRGEPDELVETRDVLGRT